MMKYMIIILAFFLPICYSHPIEKKPDFALIKDVQEKKYQFFSFMYVFVKQANENIITERKRILDIQKKIKNKQKLTTENKQFLKEMKNKYREKDKANINLEIHNLLIKVNTIPTNIALVQAADESGWGTSYFALKGNNYFGQWCFQKGCGIVPKHRDDDKIHEVKYFHTTLDSVESYMLNLNRHTAYANFRENRNKLYLKKKDATHDYSIELMSYLTAYSSRKQDYINEITGIYNTNKILLQSIQQEQEK